MIIYHQNNISAFAGNHAVYWPFQPIIKTRISSTSAGPSVTIIAQARGLHRFIQGRIFGRVN